MLLFVKEKTLIFITHKSRRLHGDMSLVRRSANFHRFFLLPVFKKSLLSYPKSNLKWIWVKKEMTVMLKHECLLLKNPFFVQFRLVLSSVAIFKKATKENSDF